VLVDCRGLESALEAVRVSVEYRKNCFKKFWNKSESFGFVPKFLD
jgi:hypothetical protein